jgi:hypothetical protein
VTSPTPHDPRAERFSGLLLALRVDRIAIAVLAVAAIVLPGGRIAEVLGALVLIGVITSGPVRVAWLARRWLRKGDRLYGALAMLLFGLPVAGLVLSVLV